MKTEPCYNCGDEAIHEDGHWHYAWMGEVFCSQTCLDATLNAEYVEYIREKDGVTSSKTTSCDG